ncbi:MAG: AgmX/PglI C-terminal domain-containing protein, partial [Kofleriaceae bacterium]
RAGRGGPGRRGRAGRGPGPRAAPPPPRARTRPRAGQTTFLVSSVPAPRRHAAGLFAGFERRTLGYVGGSLAAPLGIWMLLQHIPIADAGVSLDLGSIESTTTRSATTVAEDVPPEPEESSGNQDDGEANHGAPSMAIEGQAGRPDAADAQGRMRIKDNHAPPQLSREQAIEQARTAGFLGSSEALRGGIASLTGQMSFSSGFDDASIYGAVFGASGEGRGNFGLGRTGFGPGGGCAGEGCGIIGTGRYGTIGDGPGAGQGWRAGQGDGWPGRRQQIVPTVRISGPTDVTDGLDRAIIKRYVTRSLAKVKYCYEHELLARGDLAGTVTVQFMINAMGSVSASTGSGLDPAVASCVAAVVKNIQFPKPSNGGSVQVNYPFTFRAPGAR